MSDSLPQRMREAAEQSSADKPVLCKGFQWIGQSFASCDGCGKPYWEHDYDAQIKRDRPHPFGDDAIEYVPITPKQRAACKSLWSPGAGE